MYQKTSAGLGGIWGDIGDWLKDIKITLPGSPPPTYPTPYPYPTPAPAPGADTQTILMVAAVAALGVYLLVKK